MTHTCPRCANPRLRALRELAAIPLVWYCVAVYTARYSVWAAGSIVRRVTFGREGVTK